MTTGLGFFPINGENYVQRIGDYKRTARASERTNIAPGRNRVFTNGLTFIVGEHGVYSYLHRCVSPGEATFSLRAPNGKNVLVNVKIEKDV